jgi:hypothetical protein
VKFCDNSSRPEPGDDFALKQQIVELIEYIRAVDTGVIRCIEVRHGLPFSMEIENSPEGGSERQNVLTKP